MIVPGQMIERKLNSEPLHSMKSTLFSSNTRSQTHESMDKGQQNGEEQIAKDDLVRTRPSGGSPASKLIETTVKNYQESNMINEHYNYIIS